MREEGEGSWPGMPIQEFDPVFSPDGQTIFWARADHTGDIPRIWVMRRSGQEKRRLTMEPGRHPAPSPDGGWLAYEGRDGIRIIRTDGSGNTLIAPNGQEAANMQPVFTSDSRRIVFSRALPTADAGPYRALGWRVTPRKLYIMDLDGGNLGPLLAD